MRLDAGELQLGLQPLYESCVGELRMLAFKRQAEVTLVRWDECLCSCLIGMLTTCIHVLEDQPRLH